MYDRVLGALGDPCTGLGPHAPIGHATGLELREYVVSRLERTLKVEVSPFPPQTTRK